MSTTSHTPGPWLAYESDKTWTVAPAHTDATVIAEVGTTARSGTMHRAKASKANATLIAAAPDMLEELRTTKDVLLMWECIAEDNGMGTEKLSMCIQRIHDLIAKAEGKA